MKKYLSENAIKDRLKNLAFEQKREFNNLLKQLYLERFLARLAQSEFADHFVFKGGQLLSYYLKIGRETKDLDFLVQQIRTQSNEDTTIKGHLRSVT
ncbi:MAG: nucleotidyl transferase AbiEii/AbiGii toxin family protein [Bdellovibrionales bacterium]|nr:nucleotidyl transferase AbiEii/AbiGii toxin family protein [Bdellovibrionales bacterium]